MSGDMLKRGDSVIYHDKDHVKWGPWEVVDVLGEAATVQIEDHISYELHASLLKKVTGDEKWF